METRFDTLPDLSRDAVNDAILRARHERSEFIAAALRALVLRLRAPRPRRAPAVTGRLGTC